MTCADFADRIEDYLNGSLTEAQARELERHVEACPTCVSSSRNWRRVRRSSG